MQTFFSVAVESCKALKAEKENLANIIAGFACAEVKVEIFYNFFLKILTKKLFLARLN